MGFSLGSVNHLFLSGAWGTYLSLETLLLFTPQPNGTTAFPSDFPHHPFHGFDGGERFRGAANSAVESLLHFQTLKSTTTTNTVTADLTADSFHSALSCPVRIEKSPLLTAIKANASRRASVIATPSSIIQSRKS